MFNNQSSEEKKLDWMYKGPNSTVDREEYLLGRTVDKTLEQLNEEEKHKLQGIVAVPKNRVEHECIPPSIRDFNKVVQAEQVDLSAKLQEDPLVAIKKREEETRREFLQNPVQVAKLQKALKAQQAKKVKKKKNKKEKKKKKKKPVESDSDAEIDRDLDTILMHKFNELKSYLSEGDMQNILDGNLSESDDNKEDESSKRRDSSDENSDEKPVRNRNKDRRMIKNEKRYSSPEVEKSYKRRKEEFDSNYKNYKESRRSRSRTPERGHRSYRDSKRYNESTKRYRRSPSRSPEKDHRSTKVSRNRSRSPPKSRKRGNSTEKKKSYRRSLSKSPERDRKTVTATRNRSRTPPKSKKRESSSDEESKSRQPSNKYDSDDSGSTKPQRKNWGLVSSDGSKIPLKKSETKHDPKPVKKAEVSKPVEKHRSKKLSEEEKEKIRREMMENAAWRDKERARNVKKYYDEEEKETKQHKSFDEEFAHKQLLKSANSSSVESRIKANLNKIQRSSRDMNKHFSRR